MSKLSIGAALIDAERTRQIMEEGWTPEHDDEHGDSELAFAACYYAMPCMMRVAGVTVFPEHMYDETNWDPRWAKRGKKSRVERLMVAGALIAAEIDRCLRAGDKLPEVKP